MMICVSRLGTEVNEDKIRHESQALREVASLLLVINQF
jgi:hypothetical protein